MDSENSLRKMNPTLNSVKLNNSDQPGLNVHTTSMGPAQRSLSLVTLYPDFVPISVIEALSLEFKS
jgi:hypothetical protein